MIEFVGIDLFAGAGGVTTGIQRAMFNGRNIARVVAAINHDPLAIASHAANHEGVHHFVEDIRTFNVNNLPYIERGPNRRIFIWASLECTNFSQAKGGQSRDADSRTLAEHLFRYIEYVDPDYVLIENVKEFMTWGPLIQKRHKKTGELMYDKKGSPIMIPDPLLKGTDYEKWKQHICSYGYNFDSRLINSANYGSHTKRIRYFGIFAKDGLPIIFPQPTHNKPKWKPVREKLDLSNEGESIFKRKKPLVPKTMDRIAYGIDKYCLNGKGQFLMSYYGTGNNVHSIDDPCATITTHDRFALISPEFKEDSFLMEYYGRDNAVGSIDEPAHTITTNNRMALINVIRNQFITSHIHNRPTANSSIDEPAPPILTKDSKWLVTVETENDDDTQEKLHFISKYYGGDKHASSVEEPLHTITTKVHNALITVDIDKSQFIENRYNSKYNVSSIDEPLGSITANPKSSLITVLMKSGVIKDIRMRMLTVEELKEITGFGASYILLGTQADQKKFIGNAVPPAPVTKWFEDLYMANAEPEVILAAA